jgi:uncharacterized protein
VNTVPVVGFGLDYNYDERYVGHLDGLIDRYRDRLSHLSIVALPNDEAVDRFKEIAANLPLIHHLSNVAPANPHGADWDRLREQDDVTRRLRALWCCEDIGIWSLGPYAIPYFAPPPFEAEVADYIGGQIAEMERIVSVPFVAEVPSCSFIVGSISLGDFFHRIVDVSSCPLVLDVSHVVSYALVTGSDPLAVLASLPLKAVWEIHVAGGRVNPKHTFRYIDTHNHPVMSPVYDVLEAALDECSSLRAVTFELGDMVTHELIETGLEEIERRILASSFRPHLELAASSGADRPT